ncbi:hypothetical protein LCGC14_2024770, partial [marine sediment metagenome]
DLHFKILIVSVLVAFISIFFLGSIGEIISTISIMIAIAPILIIGWGMFYHQFKSQNWGWLLPSIALSIFGFGFVILTIFYFKVMRKEFKKGHGIYS